MPSSLISFAVRTNALRPAMWISFCREWRTQKASDVIANRSEKLWDELDKLENIYNYDKLRNLDKITEWDEFIIYSNTDLKSALKTSVDKLYKEIQLHIEFIENHDKNEKLIKLLKELKWGRLRKRKI